MLKVPDIKQIINNYYSSAFMQVSILCLYNINFKKIHSSCLLMNTSGPSRLLILLFKGNLSFFPPIKHKT